MSDISKQIKQTKISKIPARDTWKSQMAIYIKNLKVRPRKSELLLPCMICSLTATDASNNMCGQQLAAMLACWAATNDLHANTSCSDATAALFHCMRTTVRIPYFCVLYIFSPYL
jgi:hypothetical protein